MTNLPQSLVTVRLASNGSWFSAEVPNYDLATRVVYLPINGWRTEIMGLCAMHELGHAIAFDAQGIGPMQMMTAMIMPGYGAWLLKQERLAWAVALKCFRAMKVPLPKDWKHIMHLCLDSQDYRKSLITRTMATMEVYEVVREKSRWLDMLHEYVMLGRFGQ